MSAAWTKTKWHVFDFQQNLDLPTQMLAVVFARSTLLATQKIRFGSPQRSFCQATRLSTKTLIPKRLTESRTHGGELMIRGSLKTMTGWKIYIHKQDNGGSAPATLQSPSGALLAVWQASSGGLGWIDRLLKDDMAVQLASGGYPNVYTAPAQHVRAALQDGPPHANETWISGEGDVFVGTGPGRNNIDRDALEAARPDEWLLITVWDES